MGNQKAYIEVGQTIQWPKDTKVVIRRYKSKAGNIGHYTGRRQTRDTGNIGHNTGRRQTRDTGNIGHTTGRRQTRDTGNIFKMVSNCIPVIFAIFSPSEVVTNDSLP